MENMTPSKTKIADSLGSPKSFDWKWWLNTLGPLLGLVFVWVLFSGLAGANFSGPGNQVTIGINATVVAIAAVGATFVIISAGIDLSVGSTIALTTMVIGWLMTHVQLPAMELPIGGGFALAPLFALLGGVGAGLACGLLIGTLVIGDMVRFVAITLGTVLLVVTLRMGLGFTGAMVVACGVGIAVWFCSRWLRFRMPMSPFIVTLGMMGIIRGLAMGIQKNPINPGKELNHWVPDLMSRDYLIPPGIVITLIVAAIAVVILRYTAFGRHIFAVGSNEETARLCGVNVERVKLGVYAIAGATAGIAGVLQYAYLYGGNFSTAPGYELYVIAAVVIGGASLAGGQGSIFGALVGAVLIYVIDNGCTQANYDEWIKKFVTGGIIVAAVALDQLRHRRAS